MQQGKEYLVTLAAFPTITVKLGWGSIRGPIGTSNLDIKDLTNTNTPAAHVVALQDNPFNEGNYGPGVDLVLKNTDPDQPGESIAVTVITALP